MAGKPLKLNTLSRFSKRSENLALEEHGHCEVPAGCGGVVLRWVNPKRGVSCKLMMRVESECRAEVFVDGEPIEAIPFITFGRHVLAVVASEVKVAGGFLMFACRERAESGDSEYKRTGVPTRAAFKFLSLDDSTWRFSTSPPEIDGWKRSGYDDCAWSVLVSRPFPPESKEYWKKRLLEMGAVELGMRSEETPDVETVTLYVRKEFVVEEPES